MIKMRTIFTLFFLLFSFISWSQQTIKLCEDNKTEFIYMTSSTEDGQFFWYIDGTQDLSFISNFIQIDWTQYGIGFHTIEVEFISDLTCESEIITYRVNLEECPESNLYLPDAFTPNGDNINDVWVPKFQNIISIQVTIFNRWGELLYQTNDLNGGWNGFYSGSICPDGVYVYKVDYIDSENIERTKLGRIVLTR